MLEKLQPLDCSISCFERLKALSESKWEKIDYVDGCYGGQIQEGSKWKKGLSESEIVDFERLMGFEFSASLKNFYRTMNGLDRPSVDFSGDINQKPTYVKQFYSYPEDIDLIKDYIEWILESKRISLEEIRGGKAPHIFPYYGHRFLMLDENESVLSMHGSDIIYWSDNIAQGIAKDVFLLYNQQLQSHFRPVKFWLEVFE